QGRGYIRLRRLPDAADAATIESMPEWKENHARLNMEYIAPRESDAEWADAIIAGMPAGADLSPEFERYFASLGSLRKQGKLEGKIGASFMPGVGTEPLYTVMGRAGFITLPVMMNADALEA